MTSRRERTRRLIKIFFLLLIVLAATVAGLFSRWRAPNLELTARDYLMRWRGNLPVPEDIVIVAIDEKSIAKLGRFPFPRNDAARVINNISAAAPKAVAVDVLYSEETAPEDDAALANAIGRAGNVVVGEQLIEKRETPETSDSVWLQTLPAIETAAAGVGHTNVETEADGAARELLLKLADDEGNSRWALALETVRVGDHLQPDEIKETSGFVRLGTRQIPIPPVEHNLLLKTQDAGSRLQITEPLRLTIDYIGAAGAFDAQTYSFADVLENKIAADKFRGKYVLIGATAATLGDKIATPFVHAESADGDQHGALMPGVEILANELNTILRGRFYRPVSDWATGWSAAAVAFLVIILLAAAQGNYETAKQTGVLAGLLGLILGGSYLAFVYYVMPPLIPMIVSLTVAAPLAFLNRQLWASVNLDEQINELLRAQTKILTNVQIGSSPHQKRDFAENVAETALLRGFLPHGLEWKTRTIGNLAADLIARSLFIDRALRSVEDGLLIADLEGKIAFANQSALRIINLPERKLIGSSLFARLSETEKTIADLFNNAEETLDRLLIDREMIEREIAIGKNNPHYFMLRLVAVTSREEELDEPLGIVATLSDITKHRELQQTKNDVIALVTHELRTPLTAIQGMSEILTEHQVEPEPQRKMLQAINLEAKRLAKMISEYLDVTRLESGAYNLRRAPINIAALIEQSLLLLEPIAAEREIKLVRRFAENQLSLLGDADLLAQALTNIVANAIKYSPQKTIVTVETELENDFLLIKVADEGQGIPAEQLPRVFEKFYRVPRLSNADIPGTGLGLTLAREIVELHNGRITVESEINKGSIFTIHLPFSPNDL